jgi:hypothetical protein
MQTLQVYRRSWPRDERRLKAVQVFMPLLDEYQTKIPHYGEKPLWAASPQLETLWQDGPMPLWLLTVYSDLDQRLNQFREQLEELSV